MAGESSPQATSEPYRLIASPWHTLFVLTVALLNAYRAAIHGANARAGLGPSRLSMYLRVMFFEWVFLALVVFGIRLRGIPLESIFGPRWRSTTQVFRDLGYGVLLLLVSTLVVSAIYRGYLQRQFIGLTHSVLAGILFSGAAFGVANAYQGVQRAVVIGVSAVVSGVFAQWLGTVRPGMFAHTLQDAIAPLLIKLLRIK